MNRTYSTLHVILAASFAVVLVGCQTDEGSRWRMKSTRPSFGHQRQRCQSTIQPGHSADQYHPGDTEFNNGILPGHSTDYPNEYAPAPTADPHYPAPPAPPRQSDDLPPRHNPDIPSSQPPAPLIQEDVRLRKSPSGADDQVRRGTEEPDLLSPFSVRSIYEKLRPHSSEKKPVEDGPIASRGRMGAATRVCEYRNTSIAHDVGQPVRLGLPETNAAGISQQMTQRTPAVMQASPSSFRHPLLADPTGMQYGVSN